ncbi:hypothetical protein D9M68_834120 [compost metagenome]
MALPQSTARKLVAVGRGVRPWRRAMAAVASSECRTAASELCKWAVSARAAMAAAWATFEMPKWLRMRLKALMLRASPMT